MKSVPSKKQLRRERDGTAFPRAKKKIIASFAGKLAGFQRCTGRQSSASRQAFPASFQQQTNLSRLTFPPTHTLKGQNNSFALDTDQLANKLSDTIILP